MKIYADIYGLLIRSHTQERQGGKTSYRVFTGYIEWCFPFYINIIRAPRQKAVTSIAQRDGLSFLKRRSSNARATPWPTRGDDLIFITIQTQPPSFSRCLSPCRLSSQKKCQPIVDESSTGRNHSRRYTNITSGRSTRLCRETTLRSLRELGSGTS